MTNDDPRVAVLRAAGHEQAATLLEALAAAQAPAQPSTPASSPTPGTPTVPKPGTPQATQGAFTDGLSEQLERAVQGVGWTSTPVF
jgi:hypothetical protein